MNNGVRNHFLEMVPDSITPGGGSQSCVFNCFNYLDGSAYDNDQYYYSTQYYLGYCPDGSGNVSTGDIPTIGSFGGMSVTECNGSESISVSDGKIYEGANHDNVYNVMMVFNTGSGGHAVILTGIEGGSGGLLKYYDPTTGETGYQAWGQFSSLYKVGAVGTGVFNSGS